MNITRFLCALAYACVVVLTLSPCALLADESAANDMQLGVSAKPVRRTPPRYPGSELRYGRQGWVQLSYVITTDGKVVDPIVLDSSGSSAFERAALQTVEDWSYEPAIWNGEAVQQCETKVMISFALEGEQNRVSREFHRAYKKVDQSLNEGDLETAEQLLAESFESFNMSLAELSWLWSIRARYAGMVGDKEAQLQAVRKATAHSASWIDDDVYAGLLLIRTVRELESGNVSAALSSHDKLLESGAELPQMEQLLPYIEEIEALIASDTPLLTSASIAKENWNYRLLRRKFSFTDVSGDLENLEIRCSRRRVVDTAREGATWEIPESWGNCSIIVFGTPGSTFSLLEESSA